MFAESVCLLLGVSVCIFFSHSINGTSLGCGTEVAAADDQSRRGTCVCNCILSPTEGVKNPC